MSSHRSAAVRAAHLIERELIGSTHAHVGAYLLALWGLPLWWYRRWRGITTRQHRCSPPRIWTWSRRFNCRTRWPTTWPSSRIRSTPHRESRLPGSLLGNAAVGVVDGGGRRTGEPTAIAGGCAPPGMLRGAGRHGMVASGRGNEGSGVGLSGHLPQDKRQDAAVAEVFHFLRRVDADTAWNVFTAPSAAVAVT